MRTPVDIEHVIIIGAMKSGTTSLFQYLAQHPQICACKIKEPEYFSVNMGYEKYRTSSYMSLFPYNPKYHKYTLEASTGYSKYPAEKGVAARMLDYGIQPKFIYIIRNPFERIESHFNFMRRKKEWNEEIDSVHLINTSNYYMQLQQYLQYFSKENILLIDFNDFSKTPALVCQNVFNFIGAEEFVPVVNFRSNVTNEGSSNLFKRILRYTKSALPPKAANYFRNFFKTKPIKKRILTEAEQNKIYSILKADMLRLQDQFDFNVKQWGF